MVTQQQEPTVLQLPSPSSHQKHSCHIELHFYNSYHVSPSVHPPPPPPPIIFPAIIITAILSPYSTFPSNSSPQLLSLLLFPNSFPKVHKSGSCSSNYHTPHPNYHNHHQNSVTTISLVLCSPTHSLSTFSRQRRRRRPSPTTNSSGSSSHFLIHSLIYSRYSHSLKTFALSIQRSPNFYFGCP